MDLALESTAVALELETGIRHERFRFAGQGVPFDADGPTVTAGEWILGLDHDRTEALIGVTLELRHLDGSNLGRIDYVLDLPAAARSPHGAAAVRLHLRPQVLDQVVKPAMTKADSLPDLLQVRDESGRAVLFDLSNFVFDSLTPNEAPEGR